MTAPGVYFIDKWQEMQGLLRQQPLDTFSAIVTGYLPKQFQASASRIVYVASSLPGYLPPVIGLGPHPFADDASTTAFLTGLGNLAGRGAPDPLSYVPITAFCKLALQSGEVSPQLLLAQQQLAVQTLRYEIYAYDPHLVVFACGGKFSAAVRETVNALRGSANDFARQGEGNDAFLFRARGDQYEPAVLLVQPPTAFPLSAQKPWLDKAAELLR